MEKIALADKFFEKVKDGTKTSTVRYGLRNYELGDCLFYSDIQSTMVKINMISYCSFSGLTDSDAKREGYETKEELQNAVREFYPAVQDTDTMTIVTFEAG
jgi:hypothetical protein